MELESNEKMVASEVVFLRYMIAAIVNSLPNGSELYARAAKAATAAYPDGFGPRATPGITKFGAALEDPRIG